MINMSISLKCDDFHCYLQHTHTHTHTQSINMERQLALPHLLKLWEWNGSSGSDYGAVEDYLYFKEIYCTESIYSMYKGKLQNCSLNQFE